MRAGKRVCKHRRECCKGVLVGFCVCVCVCMCVNVCEPVRPVRDGHHVRVDLHERVCCKKGCVLEAV